MKSTDLVYSLRNLIFVKHGYAFKGDDFSETPTKRVLVTPGNIRIGGGFQSESLKYYSEDADLPVEYLLCTDDMLITMTDLSKKSDTLGYPLLIPDNKEISYLHNQRLGKVSISRPDIIAAEYLFYVLCTDDYRHHIVSGAAGTSVKHTSPDRILQYKTSIPPIPEQRKIADILSTVDEHISETQSLIEKTKVLKQGMMQQLLTKGIGHTEFKDTEIGRIPAEWEIHSIGEIATLSRGRVINRKEIEANKGPYPVYSSQTTDGGSMGSISTFDFDGDYLTWTTDGANAGTVFFRSGKFNCTNVCGTIKLTTPSIDARFMSFMLSTYTKCRVNYNGNPKLMNNTMGTIKIPIPTLSEQRRIANILSVIDQHVSEIESQNNKINVLKQGMMQQLLTGKIRVSV